jgi:3-hydroxyacyl-CoA dehydrogenase
MGGGIAMACANAGLSVTVKDATQAALDSGFATIRKNYEATVKRGRLTPEAAGERLGRIASTLSYDGVATADLVIEAVFENFDLKAHIFRELDAVARPGAILASNTSTLDIDALAEVTGRPQDVVGLHFFSPANIMRLLEVVRGAKAAPDVLATALAFGKRIGKVPVVVGNCRGFVGNRMLFPYMYEAQFLVEEGATPEQVDRALTEFGMAMGIFAVDDMAGIDVAWRVRQELGHFSDGGRPPAARRRQALRPRPLRPEAGQGLVSLRREPQGDAGSRGDRVDSLDCRGSGHPAAHVHRCRDRRALHLRAHQRGRAHRRRRLERAGLRHRRHLRERLRIPVVARRPDVLRRPRRPGGDPAAHPGLRTAARAALDAGAAAGGARGVRPHVPRSR